MAEPAFSRMTSSEFLLWQTRRLRAWSQPSHVGVEAETALPELGCGLPLAEPYGDIDLSGSSA